MYDFLADLDEYFCEKYANYDKLCILPGYKTPVMHATRIDEFGRNYSYTLPASEMRLAAQEDKAALLVELKKRLTDLTFSFSFRPLNLFQQIKNKFSKKGFLKNFELILSKYGLNKESAKEGLSVSEEIWTGICKGKYLPTKNLLLSLALVAQLALEDVTLLLIFCGYEWEFAMAKDVVCNYLLSNKVYDKGMIERALAEYNVQDLFIL